MSRLAAPRDFGRRPGRWPQVCFGLAGGIAAWVLFSWSIGHPEVGRFGNAFVPMSATTAAAILGLAFAGWLCLARPSPAAVRSARFVAWVVMTSALVVWAQFIWKIDLPFLAYTPFIDASGQAVIGRISPLTALIVLLASLALLFQIPAGRSRAYRQASAVIIVLVLVLTSGVTLSYLLRVPLFYRSPIIPMALLTAIALTLLEFGLLSGTGSDTWPMSLGAREAGGGGRRITPGYLILAILLTAGVGASGYAYLQHEEDQARRRAAETVSAVSALKVRQVAEWYRERRADASAIRATPLREALTRFLDNSLDESRHTEMKRWLETIHREYAYSAVVLFDSGARERVAVPDGVRIGEPDRADCLQAFRSGQIVVRDLHRREGDPNVRLNLFVPLGGEHPAAVLMLQVNAEQALFPILRVWPVATESAEMILVRREGNEVVFLNDLRHWKRTPLTLRTPIDRATTMAATRAVTGTTGVFEGSDYRGVQVVAALRHVPGTPWFLISKIDKQEIYTTYRQQVSRTAFFLAVVLIAILLGVSVLWHRRGLSWADRELVLSQRLRRIFEANLIGIVTASPNGRILEANDYYLNMIGRTREDLELGRVDWRALTPPEWSEADERALRELATRGVCAPYEKEYFRSDGTRVPALLVDAVLPGAEPQIAVLVLDLSDSKRVAAELETLARQRQLALDAAQMGWWSYDPATQRAILDARSCEIFGVSQKECPLDDLLARVHPDDVKAMVRALEEALDPADPKPYSIEYRVVLPDGVRWVEASGIATFESRESSKIATTFVGTLQNINERKVAEKALSERMHELRRWYDATLGREGRILELKHEVNQLLEAAGRPPRYANVEPNIDAADLGSRGSV